MVKLSVQHERKKERKAKSSSYSSLSGFSPTMPVLLSQLASTSGVISTSTSSAPVCSVTYAVAGPAVSAVLLPSAVAVVEQPREQKRVKDPAEQANCWESFQDWWASRRSTPSTGKSSAMRPLLVTPPVDPGSSLALVLLSVEAMSSSSRASSLRSRQSP